MKQPRMTRRSFFKMSAFGTGTLALSSVVGSAPERARADADAPLLHAPQPTFTAMPSALAFGTIADISMGWDGTLWAMDDGGAPHVYDPVGQQWQPHGTGIDGIAHCGDELYLFRGGQVVEAPFATDVASAPVNIGDKWPDLPASFNLGVTGAACVKDALYLFKGGQYLRVDAPSQVHKLTDIKGWPTTTNWKDGVVDIVGAGDGTDAAVAFIRGGEVLIVDFAQNKVTLAPTALSNGYGGQVLALLQSGSVNALLYGGSVNSGSVTVWAYAGPREVTFANTTDTTNGAALYLAKAFTNWPQTWNPPLAHAPSGRVGNLWAAMSGGKGVVYHDGQKWNAIAGEATYAAVGQDNSVFTVGNGGNTIYQWTGGTNFTLLGTSTATLSQLSVGDASQIAVRDSGNTVYSFDTTNSFQQNTAVGQAAHIATNYDGTLWHVNNSPNAFRFNAGDTASEQLTVQQGVVSVAKVASAGYGTAYCLAQTNSTGAGQNNSKLFAYQSPYVFKTQPQYESVSQRIEQGLGRLFIIDNVYASGKVQANVVALDAHTGRELWRTAASPVNVLNTAPVYDPLLNLVYVGSAPADKNDGTSQSWMIALDPQTGRIVWATATRGTQHPGSFAGIDAAPALLGTQLCFGDRQGYVHMIDTQAALANLPASTAWSALGNHGTQNRVSTPLFSNGLVYFWTWVDGQTINVQSCDANDGSSVTPVRVLDTNIADPAAVPADAPIPAKIGSPTNPTTPALFIQGLNEIHAVNLTQTAPDNLDGDVGYSVPGLTFTTGMTYANGALWVGGSNGSLYAFDSAFNLINHTPLALNGSTSPVISTPVVYTGADKQTTVFAAQQQQFALTVVDPLNGVQATVPIGNSYVGGLSPNVSNGVIYVGTSNPTDDKSSQVFGIRVDNLVSSLRDFIIESQMMQDPDQNAANGSGSTDPTNPIPPSVARYQTHLTLVDEVKVPRAYEAVKIWASEPNTVITVDGTSFTVGPDDDSFAAVQTGPDGVITVVSDATQMYAVSLRVWAGFMDAFERIVVHPDQEFHARVMTAHANANDDDPGKVNLQTTQTYSAEPLYTSDEKSKGLPAQTATTIQQMGGATGVGGGGSSSASYAAGLGLASPQAVRAGPPKYAGYADLPGMRYFPVNTPATRLVTVVAPTGLSLTNDASGSTNFAILSVADAAAAIDALEGTPWTPSASLTLNTMEAGRSPQRVRGFWSSLWDDIKRAVKKVANAVKNVIVSVAEDIYVGLQYIEDGILKVFKAIVKTLEDAVAAIGSFFMKLGKLIEDVIQALSVLFHFGEIIQTHKWLRDQINTNLQHTIDAMQNQVKPTLDNFLEQGEQTIFNLFSQVRQSLGINDDTQVNDVNSARSTPHTVFTAGPGTVGPDSGGSSHAVQCTHTTQKLKTGLPSATSSPASASSLLPAQASPTSRQDDDDDALDAFAKNFVDSLDNDPIVSAAFKALKQAISGLGHVNSAGDFFKSALNVLLTLVEDLIIGVIAVSKALIDGIIGAIGAFIRKALGFMNEPVDIPFISWLYQTVFGEPLTFLNAITLLAAIPTTIIYRAVEGRYPSQDGFTDSTSIRGVRANPEAAQVKKIQGIAGGVVALCLGIARAVVDVFAYKPANPPPRLGSIFVFGLGLAYAAIYIPDAIPGSKPIVDQWLPWGIGVALAALGTAGLFRPTTYKTMIVGVSTILRVGLGLVRFITYIIEFAQGLKNTVTDVAFARNLFLELPPMFNWLRLFESPIPTGILVGIDVVTGLVVCALDIAAAYIPTQAVQERRLYFPFVSVAPVVHPLRQ